MAGSDRETAQTVEQVLDVLQVVTHLGDASAAGIVASSGLNRTVTLRLLNTLVQRGLLSRQEGTYRAGPRLTSLADHVDPDVRRRGASLLRELAESTGATVVLHVVDVIHVVVLDQVASRHLTARIQHPVGSRHLMSRGASGRAALAWQRPRRIAEVAREATLDVSALAAELDVIKTEGFARSQGELQRGVAAVAVPVLSETAPVAWATLALLSLPEEQRLLEKHLPALKQAGKLLAEQR